MQVIAVSICFIVLKCVENVQGKLAKNLFMNLTLTKPIEFRICSMVGLPFTRGFLV